jgi:hypothetical protein
MATRARERHHPEPLVTFVIDRIINITNICEYGCDFCAFHTAPSEGNGYVLSLDEICAKIETLVALGGTQIMLHNQASAATPGSLLDAVSCANTAGATSGAGKWLDVRQYDGQILVIQQNGANASTGTLNGKLQYASDANGTGATDITGATFTAVSTANQTRTVALDPKRVIGGFLGYVGTIAVAQPIVVSVSTVGKLKYV